MDSIELYNLAEGYLGTKEEPLGSNSGLLIDQWNKQVGAPVGSFWCASFVSAMVKHLEMVNSFVFPLKVSASCDDWLLQAKRKGCLSSLPAPGALGLILSPSDAQDATHIFIVGSQNSDGTYPSIEGNSNSGGSRNGYCVAKRQNHLDGRNKNRVVYIYWWELMDDEDGWQVKLGTTLIDGLLIENSVYMPLRRFVVAFDGNSNRLTFEGKPMLNGKAIKSDMIVRDGKTYVHARSFLLEFFIPFEVKPSIKIIEIDHESPSWI